MNQTPPVRVVVAGGGTAGWIAATALARQLGRLVEITLVESEEIGTIGVGESTIPTARAFHDLLKIDQQAFMNASQASFKLAISFENWTRPGRSLPCTASARCRSRRGWPTFSTFGSRPGRAEKRGRSAEYYLEHEAARQQRFTLGGEPALNYAYHLDAGLYARFLRQNRRERGRHAPRGQDRQRRARGRDGQHRLRWSWKTASASRATCSSIAPAFRAMLIEKALGTEFEDWSHWLPCNAAWAAPTENIDEAHPYTRAIAHGVGWRWRIPLQHRVGNGLVFCTGQTEVEAALDEFQASIEGKTLRDPFLVRFRTGRRRKAWVKNCVAIGLSSGFVEPLESTAIHLIMIAATRLIQLFPFGPDWTAQRDRFNELSQYEIEQVRDFVILHYHLNQRDDTEFWRYLREMEVPDTLRHRMESFVQGAHAWQATNEIFPRRQLDPGHAGPRAGTEGVAPNG
jgi:tryptophan halogenase